MHQRTLTVDHDYRLSFSSQRCSALTATPVCTFLKHNDSLWATQQQNTQTGKEINSSCTAILTVEHLLYKFFFARHDRINRLLHQRLPFCYFAYKCGLSGELLTVGHLLYSSAICLFNKLNYSTHCIHNLLPSLKAVEYSLRNSQAYALSQCTYQLFKRFFVNWCLFNM